MFDVSFSKATHQAQDEKYLLSCTHCKGCALPVCFSAEVLALAPPTMAVR